MRSLEQSTLCATYEAHDLEMRERVAVELLACPPGAQRPAAAQLADEAQRLVDTRHPGLRVVRAIGVEGGFPFIVADAVTGKSLRNRITRGGPLAVADSVSIALQVIEAVGAAHRASLVHGNIAPAKIRLLEGPDGAHVARLMGLGVSALFRAMGGVDLRRLCKARYLAPELLGGGEAPSELTDVWQLGLLLFEMLTGTRAYDGASVEEVARQIHASKFLPVRQPGAQIPLSLERIVNAALARSPDQRLSLRDLRRALLSVREELESPGDRTARMPGAPSRGPTVVTVSDPCDDPHGTTDLHVYIETDPDWG